MNDSFFLTAEPVWETIQVGRSLSEYKRPRMGWARNAANPCLNTLPRPIAIAALLGCSGFSTLSIFQCCELCWYQKGPWVGANVFDFKLGYDCRKKAAQEGSRLFFWRRDAVSQLGIVSRAGPALWDVPPAGSPMAASGPQQRSLPGFWRAVGMRLCSWLHRTWPWGEFSPWRQLCMQAKEMASITREEGNGNALCSNCSLTAHRTKIPPSNPSTLPRGV